MGSSLEPYGRLSLIGAGLFAVGIMILAFSLFRIFRRIRYRDSGDLLRPPPPGPSILTVIFALILIAAGQACFWLTSQLQFFRPVRDDGIIAYIWIERQADPIKSLKVSFTPMVGDSMGIANFFFLSGDSWRFRGEVLNFKFANDLLKLPSMAYKVTEFNGRFVDRPPPKVADALLNENVLEGGRSATFGAFRDSPLLNWFARAAKFEIDFERAREADTCAIRLRPNGTVLLARRQLAVADSL